MIKLFFSICFLFAFLLGEAQQQKIKAAGPDSSKKIMLVEAACGQCQLGMPGKDCNLAIRINGKTYFVDGTGIDSHGDAHAADGFCNAVRKVEVQGELVNNRFKATWLRVLDNRGKPMKDELP